MAHWVSVLEVAQVNKGLHYQGASVPFVCRVADDFVDGRLVYIHGLPKSDAKGFTVNFQNGPDDSADIYLHIDVRFESSAVVLNTRESGAWKEEQRNNEAFPYVADKPFLLEVNSSGDAYDISINNQHHATFQHRMPPRGVTHLVILGDVRLPGVHFPIELIKRKGTIAIPGNVRVGSVYYIAGWTSKDVDSFSINFQRGESDDSDIIFHFNPRFGDDAKVVRNSRQAGEWNEEELDGGFPFTREAEFVVMIVARNQTFHVWVNGSKFVSFAHRMDMTTASVLNIEGGVSITDVSIDCPPDSMPSGSGFEEIIFEKSWEEDLYYPCVPVEISTGEYRIGRILCISGLIPEGAQRFQINFQYDDTENGDIALHYNPRMDEKQVVLNSREGGEWQDEIRWDEFPFRENGRFELMIYCTEENFQISLNNESPRQFPHRLRMERINYIIMKGDVNIKRAMFG